MMLVACVGSLATAANAQVTISPEAGLNLANMHEKYRDANGGDKTGDDGIKLGVKAGLNVDIPLSNHLALQPGLFYSIKGAKTENVMDMGSGLSMTEKNNLTLHWIDVPLNVQYMFNDPGEGRFFIGAGPYMAVAFSGHDIMSTSYSGPDAPAGMETTTHPKFGNDYPFNDMRRFDFGGQVNAGYLLRSGIFFRGMYQQGGINLIPQGNQDLAAQQLDERLHTTNITISVGYMLGGHPSSKGPRMSGSSEY